MKKISFCIALVLLIVYISVSATNTKKEKDFYKMGKIECYCDKCDCKNCGYNADCRNCKLCLEHKNHIDGIYCNSSVYHRNHRHCRYNENCHRKRHCKARKYRYRECWQ